jgi:hypothetical protein
MKRLLLVAVLCSTVTYTPVRADVTLKFKIPTFFGGFVLNYTISNKTFFTTAAIGASAAGICYMANRLPSWRFASAQKTFDSLNQDFVKLLASINDINQEELEEMVATQCYPISTCPIVSAFNDLRVAYEATKEAVKKLDKAVVGSKDQAFVRSCTILKGLLQDRIAPFQTLLARLRAQSLWTQQYSHFLQECNNERLACLETALYLQGFGRN